AGRADRALHGCLVRDGAARPLRSRLHAVLRRAALSHGGRGGRDGALRLRAVARGRLDALPGAARDEALPGPRLQHLPPLRRARACSRPDRPLRTAGPAPERRGPRRQRGLRPRVDPRSRREGRAGLRADHADLQGPRDRGGDHRSHRVREVAAQRGEAGTMTAAPIVLTPEVEETYLNVRYGVRSWLLTKDHKRIALLYLMSITGAFFVGGVFALGVRLELLTPEGDLLRAETYNKFFSLHGITMVF